MEHIYVEFSSTAKPFLPFCVLIRLHQLLISFCLWFWKHEKWNCCWLSFFINKAVTSAITTKSCTFFTESVDCSFYYYWKSLRFLALESDIATQVSFRKAWGNTWRESSFLQKLRKLKGLIDFHIASLIIIQFLAQLIVGYSVWFVKRCKNQNYFCYVLHIYVTWSFIFITYFIFRLYVFLYIYYLFIRILNVFYVCCIYFHIIWF